MNNLQEFHHTQEAPDIKSRAVVGIVIAIVIAGLGFYIYESVWNPTTHTIVSNGRL